VALATSVYIGLHPKRKMSIKPEMEIIFERKVVAKRFQRYPHFPASRLRYGTADMTWHRPRSGTQMWIKNRTWKPDLEITLTGKSRRSDCNGYPTFSTMTNLDMALPTTADIEYIWNATVDQKPKMETEVEISLQGKSWRSDYNGWPTFSAMPNLDGTADTARHQPTSEA